MEDSNDSYSIYQRLTYSSDVVSFVLKRPVAAVSTPTDYTPPEEGEGEEEPEDPDEPDVPEEPPECFFDFRSFAQAGSVVDYYLEDLEPLPLALIPTACTPQSFEYVAFNVVNAYAEDGERLDSVLFGSAEEGWKFQIANTTEESQRLID